MRVLLINSVCGVGSTGRICTDLAKEFESQGHEVKIAYGRQAAPKQFQKYAVRIGDDLDVKLHGLRTRLFDDHGFGSKRATKKFLQWADEYNPDLLWLHNIHGYYINIELLFAWIKSRPNMQMKWTLHDCWAITGHCSHFAFINCEKWQCECNNCQQKKSYPTSLLLDNSKGNFSRKRDLFTNIPNMTIITPSLWLKKMVEKSYLSNYPIQVIHNTIDTQVFRPTPSDFRKRYNLENKKVILGVANVWTEKKGFKDFLRLADMLDDEYKIVLVGVSDSQIRKLPANIIGIQRTNSPQELAEIYTAADVFFNPTYEDTYPTVNLEAQACGTTVVTYDTGGCRETVSNGEATVVKTGDLHGAANILLSYR